MREMRSIEIDFDIHKLIEMERNSFGETPNMVLRRLLKLEALNESPSETERDSNRGAWVWKGVRLPSGTELSMEYRGRQYRGEIQDAAWCVEGKKFKSPSAAAGGVARTKDGGTPSLDGWKYWWVRRPGESEWIALSSLRPKARQ